MPTYTYKCTNPDCWMYNEPWYILQKITDDSLTHCDRCDKDSLEKVIEASPVHFKGDGWPSKN